MQSGLSSGPVNRAAQNIFYLYISQTVIVLSIPKTSRREHSAKTLAIIISMHEENKSHAQIGDYLKLAKSTMISTIHCHNRQREHSFRPTKWADRLFKMNDQAKRQFIRHIE